MTTTGYISTHKGSCCASCMVDYACEYGSDYFIYDDAYENQLCCCYELKRPRPLAQTL